MGSARGAVAAVVLLLVTAACGGGGGPEPAPSAASTPEEATTTTGPPAGGTATAPAVPEVLRFTAAAVDGGQVAGADYAGRDVALWFWAPW